MQRGLTFGIFITIWLMAIPSAEGTGKSLVIDTFSGKVDSKGIPLGWELKENSGKAEIKLEREGANGFLCLASENSSWTLFKQVDFDIREYPILTWRWKVTRLPEGGDVRKKETDDQAGQLYVQFPRFPEMVRSQIIGYVWDTSAPKGTVLNSPSANPPPTKIVVLQSGDEKLGEWVTEKRNVYEDYKDFFGDGVPPRVKRISLWINTQRTKSSAECCFDDIIFQKAH
ncbi:MAG: DUF3047 domain-containing protein [candidate division NC10 bacterium]|nr:DUF3047 domain-containing protein [candidate division NC10 bacterium]